MPAQYSPAPGLLDRLGPGPLLIAHRGYRACYPENTLCAFAASLGRCGMIEFDVRLSGDGEAVVFHDRLLTRTSDATVVAAELGLTSLALHDWQWGQLHRLDVGSWFLETDPFGTLRNGTADRDRLLALMPQRVPTLRQVLNWAMGHRLPLNIELKEMGSDRRNEQLVAEVVREVAAAQAGGEVLLSSFNHTMLRICRRLAPEIATAALQEGAHPPDLLAYLRDLTVCAYHPADALADPALVRTLRSAGLHVNVFTVNDPHRQQQLFSAGVTGIFTDYPNSLA
jgi:glycerophosphoryl diester phosphodiesterase